MPLNKENLQIKLKQLEEYISDVKKMEQKPENQFIERSDTEILAERHIEKACQTALDIANHIVAENGLGTVTMYRELGFILAKENIITSDMAQKLAKIAGFRNRLVHEYATLSPKIIYQIVHQDIEDLTQFAKQIYLYLQKNV
ncbi:MAG: hypothetical protein UV61_C0008G0163 [Candidatus Gottesmanbacteria bacterium GW2011_GWB1_43_11]|uniref:DUF86 domain-containing protein n=1 Tax=Candidatus Gottesmanbacteria bacterium GW2011_GWB1_43_11 TaxID=1618446 RepID=A0A0G1CLT3_9BACT|nr:MAG: hypothetical protein UV04_C0009G0004 [Candidatus Gottesmanbacteria bacterium GW2011_GWA2_42_16]KKS54520.1 MAG: hypothetical protein UV17_C0017G0006 [Candidatus Gottesmanbacteria bacterium GW2011_GWA1_42_26]KKS81414.1 MAG: hypothetical protein UV55_C0014G0003 [Candidatus Gottesmanbacteria bacterium GW2011_GWC1_43_10]KKS86710.1 MAG: hypothetical protein UV61_C0008G0163 [Candidatus Gottesmanbacteria bacterium GW2011_GWB1_43_11]OGG07519.1 MAG: hypothetical protein A2699_05570 [Candidatus Go